MHFAIVGAGPAGAALGYLLARAGARVTLLERQTDFAREFRGEVLMPSGLDAIAQMGLGAALDGLPQKSVAGMALYQGARRLFELPLGAGGPRVVSQPALLEMLAREAGKWPGFSLERGFTVRDLLLRDGAVVGVRGDSPSGPREIAADWVIGADGRASAVRKHSGLEPKSPVRRRGAATSSETTFPTSLAHPMVFARLRLAARNLRSLRAAFGRLPQSFDVVWCRLPLPQGLAQQVRFYIAQGHFAIALPAPDGRLQIGWVIEKGAFGELRRRGVTEWLEELARAVSPDLGRHIEAHRDAVTSPFLLDVVCDHLDRWSAPGLLLLGDAAHPMSPIGAQGINIALRDALVAANHLAPLAAHAADPRAVLAACEAIVRERLPEVRAVQRLQRLPPRLLFGRSALSRFLVRWLIPGLARTRVLPLVFFRVAARRFLFGTTDVRLRSAHDEAR